MILQRERQLSGYHTDYINRKTESAILRQIREHEETIILYRDEMLRNATLRIDNNPHEKYDDKVKLSLSTQGDVNAHQKTRKVISG